MVHQIEVWKFTVGSLGYSSMNVWTEFGKWKKFDVIFMRLWYLLDCFGWSISRYFDHSKWSKWMYKTKNGHHFIYFIHFKLFHPFLFIDFIHFYLSISSISIPFHSFHTFEMVKTFSSISNGNGWNGLYWPVVFKEVIESFFLFF